jgi:F-type H+-transporting ATPase subunit delta
MTSKTAAIRYARALFDVARKEGGDLGRIERELAGFVDLFEAHPALKKVLLNPAVPVPRKRATMVELTMRSDTTTTVAKLLALLAERDRLIVLPDLLASFRQRVMDFQNIVRAEVVTATPLAAAKQQAIEAGLARLTGRTVSVTTKVDPSIIGGMVARVGSTVYDGSITRQLEKMKQRLIENV